MKRVIIISLILVVVIGSGVAGYVFLRPQTYTLSEDPTVLDIVTIETDTIVATVNTTGRLAAIDNVELTFATNGIVQAIHVSEEERVQLGDLLAELNATEAAFAVDQAEIELAKARLERDKLQLPPTPAEVTSAQASLAGAIIALEDLMTDVSEAEVRAAEVSLASARAKLQQLLSGPDTDSLTVAAANLRKAEISLRQAQYAYDAVAYDSRAANFQGADLEQATIDYETARANYNLEIKKADNADILAAQSQIAEAESTLDKLRSGVTSSQIADAQTKIAQAEAEVERLLAGPTEIELATAQAAIDTAQINLEKAQTDLLKTKLWSPIAGTVTSINLKVNTTPKPEEVVMRIDDLSQFKLVVDVDEIDINQVAVDQPVTISLDSALETDYQGRVTQIGLVPEDDSGGGIVAYPVTILIGSSDAPFRVGMNVNATIETERLENVVVIQNRAVEIDRQTGQTFVEKMIDEQTSERIEVTLGRRSGTVSQVLSGLEAGDQVLLRQRNRREELRRTIQGEDN